MSVSSRKRISRTCCVRSVVVRTASSCRQGTTIRNIRSRTTSASAVSAIEHRPIALAARVALGVVDSVATVRTGEILAVWAGGSLPAWTTVVNKGIPLGTFLFVLGVCLAGAAARIEQARVWLRHRRALRELRPLWMVLHDIFPQDRLVPEHEQSRVDRFLPRRVHQQFWRTVVEIRDGLVQLSPHLADVGYQPDTPLHQQTGLLDEAVRRERDGHAPSSRDAILVAAPSSTDATDVNSDVEQLVRLSRSLS